MLDYGMHMVTYQKFLLLQATFELLGGAQPVIPPNLYVYEHYSLGSSGNI